jgi:hypothetical protein
MSTFTQATPATAVDRGASTRVKAADSERARRRAMRATAVIGLVSLGLVVDLLLVGHTIGEQLWGPITAAMATVTAGLSFAFLAIRGRSRLARFGLIALWLTVAFFGYGGYNDHRIAPSVGETRPRPPLAPLMFTGLGIAGAVFTRSGSKGSQS